MERTVATTRSCALGTVIGMRSWGRRNSGAGGKDQSSDAVVPVGVRSAVASPRESAESEVEENRDPVYSVAG